MTEAGPGPAFLAAQQAAGVIAAKHRGDFAGAEELLGAIGDETVRTRVSCCSPNSPLTLVRSQTGQSMDELVHEVTLLMAEVVGSVGHQPGLNLAHAEPGGPADGQQAILGRWKDRLAEPGGSWWRARRPTRARAW